MAKMPEMSEEEASRRFEQVRNMLQQFFPNHVLIVALPGGIKYGHSDEFWGVGAATRYLNSMQFSEATDDPGEDDGKQAA